MPFHGVLSTLEQLHTELAQSDKRFNGVLWQRRLRLLMREACYFKLLLVPLVLAIAVRWDTLIPLLLALGGLYLATEALSALCSRPVVAGRPVTGKCNDGHQPPWARSELDGFLRSEFVLSGALLLAAGEVLGHLDAAILLPMLILAALLQHMVLYGALVCIVQFGEWGTSLRNYASRGPRLRTWLRALSLRALEGLLWSLMLAMLLAGGALLLSHLPGLKEALLYLQMTFALYAHQQYWIWPLCLLLGVLAGLWGRWLMTVVGYFTSTRAPRQERHGRLL